MSYFFRLAAVDVFKGTMAIGGSETCVSGRIESGNVTVGDDVCIMPINEYGSVKCNHSF